jgi:hypothetical protein
VINHARKLKFQSPYPNAKITIPIRMVEIPTGKPRPVTIETDPIRIMKIPTSIHSNAIKLTKMGRFFLEGIILSIHDFYVPLNYQSKE